MGMRHPSKRRRIFSLRGSAMTELGLVGSLCVTGLGLLMGLGLRVNQFQDTLGASFRHCLAKAFEDNAGAEDAFAVYVYNRQDRRVADIDEFNSMLREALVSSCYAQVSPRLTFAFDDMPNPGIGMPQFYVYVNNANAQRFEASLFPTGLNANEGWMVSSEYVVNQPAANFPHTSIFKSCQGTAGVVNCQTDRESLWGGSVKTIFGTNVSPGRPSREQVTATWAGGDYSP